MTFQQIFAILKSCKLSWDKSHHILFCTFYSQEFPNLALLRKFFIHLVCFPDLTKLSLYQNQNFCNGQKLLRPKLAPVTSFCRSAGCECLPNSLIQGIVPWQGPWVHSGRLGRIHTITKNSKSLFFINCVFAV